MTLTHRLSIAIAMLITAAVVVVGAAWIGYQDAYGGPADYVVVSAEKPVELAGHPYRDTLIAQADTGSAALDAGVPAEATSAASAAPAPSEAKPLPEVEPSQALKLWTSGAFLSAGALTLFLLLTFALKFDPKRAFYYTAGLTGMAGLVDLVAAGHKLTWSAVIVTVVAIAGIVVKGPQLRKS